MQRTARHTVNTVDGGEIKVAGRLLPLTVRIDRRAKRLILRLEAEGRVRVTCPTMRDVPAAIAMAHDRQTWLGDRLAEMPQAVHLGVGTDVDILGRPTRIARAPGRRAQWNNAACEILIPQGPPDRQAGQLKSLLSGVTADACRHLAGAYARELGVTVGRIRIRDMRTRWGSCASSGDLTFNWRLCLAPYDVLDYVVAHETAHRRHMNHSPAFWQEVAEICPDYRRPAAWLRENGSALFAYQCVGTVDAPATAAPALPIAG